MKTPLSLGATAIALAFSLPAMANPSSESTADYVITATRTAQTADQNLTSVHVITQADIERSQARSVQEILSGLSGVQLTNPGGTGQPTSLFLRGTNSNHVLVLVDGLKMGSATLGTVSFEHLPIDQIERIEVVKGPRSSLYGSEAIGGVVQIFTKKGDGTLKSSMSATLGSDNTRASQVGFSGGNEKSWFRIGLSSFSTDGNNACRGNLSAGCYVNEPDKDGYRNHALSLRGGIKLANQTEAEVFFLHSRNNVKSDGSLMNENNGVQQNIGAKIRQAFSPSSLTTLTFGRSDDRSVSLKDGVFYSFVNTQRNSASLQHDINWNQSLFTLGTDIQLERIDGSSSMTKTSRRNQGYFVQYQTQLDKNTFQGSLRQDHNEESGDFHTGTLSWGHTLTPQLKSFVSLGSAFKMPTFNDLYFPGPYGKGDPTLQPEKSRSAEIGLQGIMNSGQWNVQFYRTKINNLIVWVDPNNTWFYVPKNLNQATIQGIDAGFKTQWNQSLFLNTQLTVLKAINTGEGNDQGKYLPRRAGKTLKVEGDYKMAGWLWGAQWNVVSRRYDDTANTVALGGYSTLDLRAQYALNKAWTIQTKLENVFDRQYESAAWYQQPGRRAFVTLRYQP